MSHRFCLAAAAALGIVAALARPAAAQVTPAAGYTPPDDTPSIKVGATIFTDYTFQQKPEITDADGNRVHSNSFNVSRAYINVTGQISHWLAFRITPDIVRESGLVSLGTGNTVSNDSLVFRLKYAFAQVNLDDFMPKGSWARLGIQQTPWVDFEESIYRYRFQGPVFMDREGYLSSSDAGASFHANFPQNYGDFHVGFYNGDTYSKPEANDQKAFQVRGTLRPVPMAAAARGLRITVFYDHDAYVKNADRQRFLVSPTFEHKYLNAGFQYARTNDQTASKAIEVHGEGWSFWATPRSTTGVEGLIRYDHLKPNTDVGARRNRQIVGIAYWLPHQGNVSSAFMFDMENVDNSGFPEPLSAAQIDQRRFALHALVNF